MDAPENTCVKGTANSPQGRYKQVQPTPLIGVGAPATISLLLKFCGFYNTMIQLRQTICIFLYSFFRSESFLLLSLICVRPMLTLTHHGF